MHQSREAAGEMGRMGSAGACKGSEREEGPSAGIGGLGSSSPASATICASSSARAAMKADVVEVTPPDWIIAAVRSPHPVLHR
jgi:hypothetical protein